MRSTQLSDVIGFFDARTSTVWCAFCYRLPKIAEIMRGIATIRAEHAHCYHHGVSCDTCRDWIVAPLTSAAHEIAK